MAKTNLSVDEIKRVARLAALPLSEEELVKFDKELSETVNYVSRLNELETKNIVPTPQVTQKVNELRDDVITPSLPQALALKNAKKTHKGYFVSKISWS